MSGYWIVKSEPEAYSFGDLVRDGKTVWDGVRNAQALNHLRAMQKGDQVLFYHTGDQRELVGLARVVSAPYADPKGGDPKLAVVDLAGERELARPVPLAAIKAEPSLATLGLVRQGRLSVMPATAAEWKRLMGMAGE